MCCISSNVHECTFYPHKIHRLVRSSDITNYISFNNFRIVFSHFFLHAFSKGFGDHFGRDLGKDFFFFRNA